MVTPSHIRQLLGNLISVRNWSGITLGIAIAVFTCRPQTSAQAAAKLAPLGKAEERSRVAFSHALTKMDGANLKVFIVEVIYGPGGSSPSHSHPCPVIGYVIEGAYRTQVKGEPEAIYKAGESFYEAANGIHQVSANASAKEPVKFLAYFVCDHDSPLSVETPETKGSGGT